MEAIACGLQLLPAHIGHKEAAPWGLDALAGQQFVRRKLFFPLQEELRHRSKADAVTVMGFLFTVTVQHHNVRNGKAMSPEICRVVDVECAVNILQRRASIQRCRINKVIVGPVHGQPCGL